MSNCLIWVLVVVTAVSGVPYSQKIVGGEEVDIIDYPYQVSIEYAVGETFGHNCGGSIISPKRILTAGHCVDWVTDLTKMRIRAGSSIREQGGQVVTVKKIYLHPEYTGFENDIAVLILSNPLAIGSGVQTIQIIGETEDVPAGTLGTVTGWGKTENGELASHLLKVDLPRVADSDCSLISNSTITVCYGGEIGKDACSADSGGPMVVDGIQTGIVSFGPIPCRGIEPGVYVKLGFFRNFIDNETPDV